MEDKLNSNKQEEIEQFLSQQPTTDLLEEVFQWLRSIEESEKKRALISIFLNHFFPWQGSIFPLNRYDVWPSFPKGEPESSSTLALSFRKERIKEPCDEAILYLQREDVFKNLHYLDFDSISLSKKALERLFSSRIMEHLQWLSFSGMEQIGAKELSYLLQSNRPSQLTTLKLHSTPIGSEGAELIASSPFVRKLRNLKLESCYIGDEGATALAESPFLSQLEQLTLNSCDISSSGFQILMSSTYLQKIESITLVQNKIKDDAMIDLVFPPTLCDLNLALNQISDVGAISMARSPALLQLKYLFLCRNHIGDSGAFAFAESPFVQNLVSFDLGDKDPTKRSNNLSKEGFASLSSSPYISDAVREGWFK